MSNLSFMTNFRPHPSSFSFEPFVTDFVFVVIISIIWFILGVNQQFRSTDVRPSFSPNRVYGHSLTAASKKDTNFDVDFSYDQNLFHFTFLKQSTLPNHFVDRTRQ